MLLRQWQIESRTYRPERTGLIVVYASGEPCVQFVNYNWVDCVK